MCYISLAEKGSVRVFKTRWFVRFARKERIADRALRDAVDHATAARSTRTSVPD
ncbi:MAG: type II toxin-antitoxin system RelE/ParE family toxin [Hyphomicrobiaceae bacterium]